MHFSVKHLILIILILTFNNLISQEVYNIDSINKLNEKGRKDGIWLEYIDKDWKCLKNTEKDKAIFKRYVYFDEGFRVTCSNRLKNKVFKTSDLPKVDKLPILLDGIYDFYYKNGNKYCTVKYKKGIQVGKHLYFYKNGKIMSEYNYEVRSKNNPYTFYYKEFNRDGSLKYYGYYCRYRKSDWVILPMGLKPEDLKKSKN